MLYRGNLITSRTVSKISRSRPIGKIFVIDSGRLSLTYSFEVNHKFKTTKFGDKKLETSLYRTVQKVYRYVELFSRDLQVWRTSDGQIVLGLHSGVGGAQLHVYVGWTKVAPFVQSLDQSEPFFQQETHQEMR